MKPLLCLSTLLASAVLARAAASGIDTVVRGIPADATEVVLVVDTVAPAPAANPDDPAAPAAGQRGQRGQRGGRRQAQAPAADAPVAAAPAANQPPAAAADPAQPPPAAAAAPADPALAKAAAPAAPAPAPAAFGQRRGRRGGAGGMAGGGSTFTPVRTATPTKGATELTLHSDVPAGDNYQIRVIAIGGDGNFPSVLAGGHVRSIKVAADTVTPEQLALTPPKLTLNPALPATVAAGTHYKISGIFTDAAEALGTKTRMRVWVSQGTPPAENYAGAQISTVDVTIKDDDVAFNFDLIAPAAPTTLYLQFGELPPDFVRADNRQAPFLVLPDLSRKAAPLALAVTAAPAAKTVTATGP